MSTKNLRAIHGPRTEWGPERKRNGGSLTGLPCILQLVISRGRAHGQGGQGLLIHRVPPLERQNRGFAWPSQPSSGFEYACLGYLINTAEDQICGVQTLQSFTADR